MSGLGNAIRNMYSIRFTWWELQFSRWWRGYGFQRWWGEGDPMITDSERELHESRLIVFLVVVGVFFFDFSASPNPIWVVVIVAAMARACLTAAPPTLLRSASLFSKNPYELLRPHVITVQLGNRWLVARVSAPGLMQFKVVLDSYCFFCRGIDFSDHGVEIRSVCSSVMCS